ncbi:MAG: hypothetical protein ABSG67_03190 [Thermoguttaceae bacterium]
MCIKKFFPSLFMFLAAAVLSAAEPEVNPQTTTPEQAMATIPTVPDEPVIPKRELKFDASEEEVPLPLGNVQEGMLDQHYVVTFRFVFAKNENNYENRTFLMRGDMSGPIRIGNVIGLNNGSILDSLRRYLPLSFPGSFGGQSQITIPSTAGRGGRGSGPGSNNFMSASEYKQLSDLATCQDMLLIGRQRDTFRPFEKNVFSSTLPPEIIAALFDKQDFLLVENNISLDQNGDPENVQIRLLYPSAEEAKKCVEAWFDVYDKDVCYNAQKVCLNVRNKLVQMLPEYIEKLKNAQADLSKAQQEMEKYQEFTDITHEALTGLTTQRRMLEVDLAGIKARIEACQEMLAKSGNMPAARKDQIETARVTAEIELRGLDAKRAEIDRIVNGAQKRQKLDDTIRNYPNSVLPPLIRPIENTRRLILELDDYQLGFRPLPIEGDKITIRRIKWISPPKTEKSKSDSKSQ